MTESPDLADPEKLSAWLDLHVPELGIGPLRIEQLHGGTSNVILTLNRGGQEMVLRRPPAVPPPGSEKGVLREARVLTALNGTPVPHPHCFGSCDDPEVIGAPFYVMERVPGWAAELRDEHIYHRAPFDRAPSEYGIAYAMVDGLIALANVDYRAVGLEGFGKPDNFLERQVDRWEGQIRSYPELYGTEWRELPGFAYARDWLRANVPDDFRDHPWRCRHAQCAVCFRSPGPADRADRLGAFDHRGSADRSGLVYRPPARRGQAGRDW